MLNTFAFSEWKMFPEVTIRLGKLSKINMHSNRGCVKMAEWREAVEERRVAAPLITHWFLSYLVVLKFGLGLSHLAELGKVGLGCKYVRK